MKNNRKIIARCYLISFLIATAMICGGAYAEAVDPAGHAIFVHDSVWRITTDEAKLPLQKGDSVYESDTITTGEKGSAQLVMSDGAYIAIRPNTSIRLDVYHYDKKEAKGFGECVISLIKGCFRSITGLIGKENKENYRIKTPVASIGIRGTDHEPLYIPEPEEGEIPIGEPGLYDKVNSGETYIENEAGIVTVLPNQVGFASNQTTTATVDDTIPEVYDEFTTTESEESMEASNEESDDSSMSGEETDVFSDTASLDEQADARVFALDTTVIKPRPARNYGIFTSPDAINDNYYGVLGFSADETEMDRDDSGHLTGYQLSHVLDGIRSVQLVNPTEATTPAKADNYSETTIEYGTLYTDSIEQTRYDGTVDSFPVGSGLVHWINGTVFDSNYLSQVITGTQTYAFDGGTAPTNQAGVVGTLNNASLAVDFTRQAVDVALQLDVNGHSWDASGTDIPIIRGHFSASNPGLSVQRDGSSSSTIWGYLDGSFAGEGLSGAFFGYALGDSSISETVNGTAAFYAAGQDTTTSYREIGIAGPITASMPSPLALFSPSAVSPSRLSTDSSGNLTQFDAMIPVYGGDDETAVNLEMGAAILADAGTDADTGISWGRWSGTVTATDRMTETSAATSFDPQDLHFIAGPEMSSAVTLPITGTKTYAFAGGTQPTDNLGNIGTLNSASLTADFTNLTVATGINATVGTTTFDAASAATPIESGRYFTATTNDSLTLACTGAGTNTGIISGSFYGENGASAGMAYSFNTTDGGSLNTTISGVAAFK